MIKETRQDLMDYLSEEFDPESATSALLLVKYNGKHESGQGVTLQGRVANDELLEFIITLVWKYGEKLASKDGIDVEASDATSLLIGMNALIERVDSVLGVDSSEEEDIPEPPSAVRH